MIYFHKDLIYKAVNMVKELYELRDVKEDMDRIESAILRLHTVGDHDFAQKLDDELRIKYPAINLMIEISNTMPRGAAQDINRKDGYISPEETLLEQDKYGIICDVLMKKRIVSSIDQCISGVTMD